MALQPQADGGIRTLDPRFTRTVRGARRCPELTGSAGLRLETAKRPPGQRQSLADSAARVEGRKMDGDASAATWSSLMTYRPGRAGQPRSRAGTKSLLAHVKRRKCRARRCPRCDALRYPSRTCGLPSGRPDRYEERAHNPWVAGSSPARPIPSVSALRSRARRSGRASGTCRRAGGVNAGVNSGAATGRAPSGAHGTRTRTRRVSNPAGDTCPPEAGYQEPRARPLGHARQVRR
jgi:hypothetical protein